jgi:hypothetical protein
MATLTLESKQSGEPNLRAKTYKWSLRLLKKLGINTSKFPDGFIGRVELSGGKITVILNAEHSCFSPYEPLPKYGRSWHLKNKTGWQDDERIDEMKESKYFEGADWAKGDTWMTYSCPRYYDIEKDLDDGRDQALCDKYKVHIAHLIYGGGLHDFKYCDFNGEYIMPPTKEEYVKMLHDIDVAKKAREDVVAVELAKKQLITKRERLNKEYRLVCEKINALIIKKNTLYRQLQVTK